MNVVNLNFSETNCRVFIASSSFDLPHTLCSSYICASALSTWLCCVCVCIDLLSPTETVHQVAFVLELDEENKHFLCRFCIKQV